MAKGEKPLDWASGESCLLIASLGFRRVVGVRLTGQDSEREAPSVIATRSFIDYKLGAAWSHNVFSGIDRGSNRGCSRSTTHRCERGCAFSRTSTASASTFPKSLIIWEAQFGDFANVAQVIIDQFITSGEDKWQRFSGLTLLLPHGFEGQGPEHSSARLERFLMAAAEDNIQVVNLTSPAQVFHMLRRQVLRRIRKPMVVMSPKSLLRHPEAVSTLDDLANGHFQQVIADDAADSVDPSKVRKIVMTSGKLFYELRAERKKRGAYDVALIRMEQLYPVSKEGLQNALADYPDGTPLVWAQEEPENMGAWPFMLLTFRGQVLDRFPLEGVYRPRSASPATGSAASHKKEQALVIEQAFA